MPEDLRRQQSPTDGVSDGKDHFFSHAQCSHSADTGEAQI